MIHDSVIARLDETPYQKIDRLLPPDVIMTLLASTPIQTAMD